MAAAYLFNGKVDEVVADMQRKELGLCSKCGGLYSCESCPLADCPEKRKSS